MRRAAVILMLLTLMGMAVAARAQQAPPAVAPEVFERGRAALTAENFEQALTDFSLYILLNPTSAQGYYGRALAYESLERLDLAIADLGRAIVYSASAPPLQAVAYATRADLLGLQGEFQAALADYGEALRLNPTPENYAGRALVHLTELHYDDAIRDLDEAISLSTGSLPILYYYRATAKSALEAQEAAAGDYLEWVHGIQEQATDASPLEAGQPVTLDLAPGAVYHISFEASAGDSISAVAANASGDIDPLIVLTDANGNALVGNDDLPNGDTSAMIADYEIPKAGRYTLLVTHSVSGYNGRVTVLLEKNPAEAT